MKYQTQKSPEGGNKYIKANNELPVHLVLDLKSLHGTAKVCCSLFIIVILFGDSVLMQRIKES